MQNLIIAVTGSVATIKLTELVKGLASSFNIRIVTTQSAEYFLKGQLKDLSMPIYRDIDEWPPLKSAYEVGKPILHIEMRRWADILLIAPLDANTLAKITAGMCDNLLTSIFRAWDWSKPLLVCPAMNTFMWENPPTAMQIQQLREWGVHIIEPIVKKLACQDIGFGAMAEVSDIINYVLAIREK